MDRSWLLTVSTVSVYLFAVVVLTLLSGLAVVAFLRRRFTRDSATSAAAPRPLGAPARMFIEYVGNTSCADDSFDGVKDRRRNWVARFLMDHARAQALGHGTPPPEVNRLVEQLREAIQAAERVD
jgi:hypothetical protein